MREGIGVARHIMGPQGLAMPLAGFAFLAAALGQPARAAQLCGAVAAICDMYRAPLLVPLFEPLLRESRERARRELDDEAFEAAWVAGRTMPLEASLAAALDVEPQSPAASIAEPFGRLTATELRILRLLATGRTTREIASERFVSVSTIDRHLTHIYTKLGVRNRAEAAAFALTHGLSEDRDT